jgi:hypothetical protein
MTSIMGKQATGYPIKINFLIDYGIYGAFHRYIS